MKMNWKITVSAAFVVILWVSGAKAKAIADPAKALVSDQMALRDRAEHGDVTAQLELGKALIKQSGAGSKGAAIEWLRKAAEQGSVRAESILGQSYVDPFVMAPNPAIAEPWLRKAAEGGDLEAQFRLAYLYENQNGHGLSANPEETVKWMRKVAEHSSADFQDDADAVMQDHAERYLCGTYLTGAGPQVKQDYSEAYFWCSLTANHDEDVEARFGRKFFSAKDILWGWIAYEFTRNPEKLMYDRDRASLHLTAEQESEIEKRLNEWAKAHPAPVAAQKH